jgi:hypothetical protein
VNRPSSFIVGHSKSGTTALGTFLEQHPDLFMCDPMEPNYFCPAWCRAPGPPSRFFRLTEPEYLALFDAARPGQQCFEASAVYLYSPEAPARIYDFDPNARIIMIFREPVAFLRSYHLQLLKNTPTEAETIKDLGEALRLEPARRRGEAIPDGCVVPELLYYGTERLRYEEHYDRFASLFPEEQILALIYDDFRRDNLGTVRRVFEFLGVDPGFRPSVGEHNAGGVALRSRRAEGMMRRASHAQGLARLARRSIPKRLRRRAARTIYNRVVFEEPPPLEAAVVADIRARARPHVEALGDRLGRDLVAEWGYSQAQGPLPAQAA